MNLLNTTVSKFEEWRARGMDNHPKEFEAYCLGYAIEAYHLLDEEWYIDACPSWAADVCYRIYEDTTEAFYDDCWRFARIDPLEIEGDLK